MVMSIRLHYMNGVLVDPTPDCDWGLVYEERKMMFEVSDLWMREDRYEELSGAQQTELKTYRAALRDITEYATANEAADNFPIPPSWMYN